MSIAAKGWGRRSSIKTFVCLYYFWFIFGLGHMIWFWKALTVWSSGGKLSLCMCILQDVFWRIDNLNSPLKLVYFLRCEQVIVFKTITILLPCLFDIF
ncbi:hypothetical protein BD289DRAFT_278513 [Coniella lustricola]|uniref:Uncharacterized protein n=1 Tax=Coniella lustricola TaxID=2025994 RepID=A0A2T3A6C8_9PEZI|nr:hypothetical protein BD289DRAFT_278513 [Coniella lustricola]